MSAEKSGRSRFSSAAFIAQIERDAPMFEAAWRLGGHEALLQAIVAVGRSCWKCPACLGKPRWADRVGASRCLACHGQIAIHYGWALARVDPKAFDERLRKRS